jgi:hypothetical protein
LEQVLLFQVPKETAVAVTLTQQLKITTTMLQAQQQRWSMQTSG